MRFIWFIILVNECFVARLRRDLVKFRQPIPDDQLSGEEDEHDEDNQGPETENYCDFTIYITDSNGKNGLVIEGTTVDTELNYNTVQVSSDVNEQKSLHRLERQIKQYAGPDFSTLDERIQTSLTEYLEGFGINEHLGAFVECMSLDKDQRLYMNWLTNLKNFVEDQWAPSAITAWGSTQLRNPALFDNIKTMEARLI